MSEENNAGAPAEVTAEENKDQDSIEKQILADPDVSAADFQRARSDPAFMGELVAKREKPSESKPDDGDGETKVVKTEEVVVVKPDDDSEDADAPKKRKRGGFKRMAERARDESDVLKRENEDLRRQLATKAEAPPPKENKEGNTEVGKPKEDDFDSHVDYLEASTDWKVEYARGILKPLSERGTQDPSGPAFKELPGPGSSTNPTGSP